MQKKIPSHSRPQRAISRGSFLGGGEIPKRESPCLKQNKEEEKKKKKVDLKYKALS